MKQSSATASGLWGIGSARLLKVYGLAMVAAIAGFCCGDVIRLLLMVWRAVYTPYFFEDLLLLLFFVFVDIFFFVLIAVPVAVLPYMGLMTLREKIGRESAAAHVLAGSLLGVALTPLCLVPYYMWDDPEMPPWIRICTQYVGCAALAGAAAGAAVWRLTRRDLPDGASRVRKHNKNKQMGDSGAAT